VKENFDRAFDLTVMRFEGGAVYTNDPNDPGGETKYGISKRAYPNLDIRNLTKEKAKEIFRTDYWNPVGGDEMPYPWDIIVTDAAFNLGVSQAFKLKSKAGSPAEYHIERIAFYTNLVVKKPALLKYLRGWINRVIQLWNETK